MKKDLFTVFKPKLSKIASFAAWPIVLFLILSTVRNVQNVVRIRGEVEKERARLVKAENDAKDLEQRLADTKSPEFIEKEIRNKLGLVKTGETVVVLPDTETLRKLAPKINPEEDTLPDPNWKRWLKLFF